MLDPFSGTGTTAIAAKRLGRNYIGLELDRDYVEISQQKLARVAANSKLGDCWVSFYLDKVVTLRDNDWEYLQNFFHLPPQPEQIDATPIVLKSTVALPNVVENQASHRSNPCAESPNQHDQTLLF